MSGARVLAVGVITGWGEGVDALPDDAKRAAEGRSVVPLSVPPRPGDRFRRATRECLIGVTAVEGMMREAGIDRAGLRGPRTGLVYCTAAAYGASNRTFIEGAAGALHFPYTAPSAVPAEVAIEFGFTGSYVILIGGATATIDGLAHAVSLVARDAADQVIVLAVETFTECAALFARGRWLVGSPLVEAAAAALVVPDERSPSYGADVRRDPMTRADAGHDAVDHDLVQRRAGETLACGPLIALGLALAAGIAPAASARWRGRHAAIAWTDPA